MIFSWFFSNTELYMSPNANIFGVFAVQTQFWTCFYEGPRRKPSKNTLETMLKHFQTEKPWFSTKGHMWQFTTYICQLTFPELKLRQFVPHATATVSAKF